MWGCGGTDTEEENNNNNNNNPGQTTYKVSECGGFAKLGKSDTYGYCDANTLDWSYDKATGKLKLIDKRVLLNCCGDHTVKVKQENGTFVIREIDAPEQGNMRCKCMCVYDFEVTFDTGVVPVGGLLPIKLVRDTTDDNEPAKTVFSGKLDLSQGSGTEVLDKTDVGPWCESSAPEGPSSQSYAISECGGFDDKQKSDDTYQLGSYCANELLLWKRDPKTGAVTFTDQRVELNCCGDRSITAADQGGVLVITVTDAPEQGNARCFCMCVFDFAITVGKLSGKVPVKLVRDITDDNQPPKTVYSGTLDLTAPSGVVIVDKNPATFCQ
jgi:hypothetical protein